MKTTASIHINGIVQGVGFRPFVARLARQLGVCGTVCNSTNGVEIMAQAEPQVLELFADRLKSDAPAASRIIQLEVMQVEAEAYEEFLIVPSKADDSRETLVSPDLATCPACRAELFDPANRRYRYPFINCTNCGPRFTIINDLPYDRPATSMSGFVMCPDCASEYADENDRRFHAQPDACFECGPQLWGCGPDGRRTWAGQDRKGSDALIAEAVQRLRQGQILAIKGLGGWHLSCDATNAEAVQKLRDRKYRPSKPLAVMVATAVQAEGLCDASDEELELLETPLHPIVLMPRLDSDGLATNVAGQLPELGVMLPSTPLQHLLLCDVDLPLVMTSGNRSGEPIVAGDEEALEALGHIADWFLGNNRDIVARYDDSVTRILSDGTLQVVRRARGYAPSPLFTSGDGSDPVIFAAGPEQKSTFCYLKGDRAFLSQHLGDLESAGSWNAWLQAKERYERLFGLEESVIACDLHPEYLSSKWARKADRDALVEVQHHHAHIASVMGENALQGQVLGLCMDGTGYGTDGTIWGCELLACSRGSFERLWHLPAFKLPGGAAAVKEPWRTGYSLLREFDLVDDPRFAGFVANVPNRIILDKVMDKGLNCPTCSSAGRLFDGVAALMGLCSTAGYDGEPACLLEARAVHELRENPFMLRDEAAGNVPGDSMGLMRWLLGTGKALPLTASGLHARLAKAIIEQCVRAREETGLSRIALSGGCMANRLLLSLLRQGLQDAGFETYMNVELPPNDGCIAYGQAIAAQARLKEN